MNNLIYPPEQLNFWDRIFNRYKKVVAEEGEELWNHYPNSYINPFDTSKINYSRSFVKYHKIDRLTGSYTVEKVYLD